MLDRTAVLGAVEAGAVLAMLGRGLRVAARRARDARSLDRACARRGWGGVARARCVGDCRRSYPMLRIYPVLLSLVESLVPLLRQLERQDPDLARQCRRALASAPLNVAEGSYSQGRNRKSRYHTALGSLREALACLEVAAALGYMAPVEPELRKRFDHILGTLVRLVGGHG